MDGNGKIIRSERRVTSDEHSRAKDDIYKLLALCTLKGVDHVRYVISRAVILAPLAADELLQKTLKAEDIDTRLADDVAVVHYGMLAHWSADKVHQAADSFRQGRQGDPTPVFNVPEVRSQPTPPRRRRRFRFAAMISVAAMMFLFLGVGWANAWREGQIDRQRAAVAERKMLSLARGRRNIVKMLEVLKTKDLPAKDQWITIIKSFEQMSDDLERTLNDGLSEKSD